MTEGLETGGGVPDGAGFRGKSAGILLFIGSRVSAIATRRDSTGLTRQPYPSKSATPRLSTTPSPAFRRTGFLDAWSD